MLVAAISSVETIFRQNRGPSLLKYSLLTFHQESIIFCIPLSTDEKQSISRHTNLRMAGRSLSLALFDLVESCKFSAVHVQSITTHFQTIGPDCQPLLILVLHFCESTCHHHMICDNVIVIMSLQNTSACLKQYHNVQVCLGCLKLS